MSDDLITEANPWIMSAYIFYASLLSLKLLSMQFLTTITRMRTKIVSNAEDLKFAKSLRMSQTHPLLNRVSRMHVNDLENIVPFLILGFLYSLVVTGPYSRSVWHFRIFFSARVMASIFHFFALQPYRSVCYLVAFLVNLSLVGHIVYKASFSRITRYL